MKLLNFLKKYYFYIFSAFLLFVISIVKFFPNITSTILNVKKDKQVVSTSTESSSTIFIDISGAVNKPGVYKLLNTSRVGDALKVAGGISPNASVLWISRNINLAKLIEDTQKIYVPYEWETYGDCTCKIDTLSLNIPNIPTKFGSTSNNTNNESTDGSAPSSTSDTPSSADTNTININNASLEELDALSGIGPTYAQKILDNKPYTNLEDLISKSGIPKSTIEKISSEISF